MEGLFYCYDDSSHPTYHLLRFYPEDNNYVLAKELNYEVIPDVNAVLKKFAMNGFELIGEKEFIYVGAYSEYDDSLKFKIENEISNPADTWVEYDLLTFKGKIINPDLLEFEVSSKTRQWVKNRTYKRVTGNTITNE